MLEEVQQKLGDEVEALIHELNVTLPKHIETAVAHGDLRENSEYHAALERQGFVRARIDYLSRRLKQLADIDVEHVATDRVGFGSRVEVRDTEDQEVEFFTITLGDALDFENNEISMEGPIGRALLGKKKGESVNVILPGGARELEVLDFETIHHLQDRPG